MVCPLFGGLSSFGVSFIGGFTVVFASHSIPTCTIVGRSGSSGSGDPDLAGFAGNTYNGSLKEDCIGMLRTQGTTMVASTQTLFSIAVAYLEHFCITVRKQGRMW